MASARYSGTRRCYRIAGRLIVMPAADGITEATKVIIKIPTKCMSTETAAANGSLIDSESRFVTVFAKKIRLILNQLLQYSFFP